MGPRAKDLEKIGKRMKYQPLPPETVDVTGYFSDGRRAARHGNKCNPGSLKLKENRDAYVAGYCAGYNGF
jgi:hypothetical protein